MTVEVRDAEGLQVAVARVNTDNPTQALMRVAAGRRRWNGCWCPALTKPQGGRPRWSFGVTVAVRRGHA